MSSIYEGQRDSLRHPQGSVCGKHIGFHHLQADFNQHRRCAAKFRTHQRSLPQPCGVGISDASMANLRSWGVPVFMRVLLCPWRCWWAWMLLTLHMMMQSLAADEVIWGPLLFAGDRQDCEGEREMETKFRQFSNNMTFESVRIRVATRSWITNTCHTLSRQ